MTRPKVLYHRTGHALAHPWRTCDARHVIGIDIAFMLLLIGLAVKREQLVEGATQAIASINRGHILVTVVLLSVIAASIWLGGNDAARMLLMSAPDVATMLSAFEVSSFVDAVVAVTMVAASLRLSMFARMLRIRRRRPSLTTVHRHTRAARRQTLRRPANDDEDGASHIRAA